MHHRTIQSFVSWMAPSYYLQQRVDDKEEGLIESRAYLKYVTQNFPNNEEKMMEEIIEMESEWQFPYTFCAVDGCHLPMRCPRGGEEHHNFKNFYSVILMALVDA